MPSQPSSELRMRTVKQIDSFLGSIVVAVSETETYQCYFAITMSSSPRRDELWRNINQGDHMKNDSCLDTKEISTSDSERAVAKRMKSKEILTLSKFALQAKGYHMKCRINCLCCAA